ncbi:MAG: putative transcriptional regulator, partial [Roseivirga sp.]
MVRLKKVLFTVLFVIAFSCFAFAQDELANDSIVYTADIQRIFSTPNPASFGADYQPFIEKWQSSGFTTDQKNQIGQSLLNMEKKGFRPRFDFKGIFNILSSVEDKSGFNQEQLNALIKACLRVSEDYDKKLIDQFYQYSAFFITDKALYKDRSYGIYVKNGTSELKFNGYDDFEDEAPIVQEKQGPDAIELLIMKQQGIVPEETEPKINPADEPLSSLPLVMGPVIELQNIDLVFLNRLDTIYLRGTSGTFSFETLEFKGQGGAIDWTNVGLPAESAYAKLRNYVFNVTQTDIKFEETFFHYTGKLNDPVSGTVEITLTPQRTTVDNYPKFVSDYADAPINDLGTSGLRYIGGVSYEGRQFFSRSAFNELSTIEAFLEGERKFKAQSSTFFFNKKDSVVTSPQAQVTIYHGADSIYHPAVEFSYQYGIYQLNLEPQKKDFRTTPFNSSYYNVDLTGDLLTWNVKSDSLNISILSARTEVPLVVESKNFYSASRFNGLSQLYNFHPLIIAVRQAQKYEPKNEFYLTELADERKLNIGILKRTMIDLMSKGMVLYNSYTDQVIITEKGLHYYDSARDES